MRAGGVLGAIVTFLNDPDVIEHWYYATWSYNGWTYSNSPNNPIYDADRPELRTPGYPSAMIRDYYPYQERIRESRTTPFP